MSSVFRSYKAGRTKRVTSSIFEDYSLFFSEGCCVFFAPLPSLRGQSTVVCHTRWQPQQWLLHRSPSHLGLTLIQMAIKKCTAMRLGVIYDFQATNRNLEGLLSRTTTPSGTLLLVAWQSYMTTSQPEWTKIPPETGRCSSFFIKNHLKHLFFIKTFSKI
jgi:hypothetical protein